MCPPHPPPPSAFLIGISNCTWSSCRHGCTAEVYKCWQVQVRQHPLRARWFGHRQLFDCLFVLQVNFTLVPKSAPIPPPWGSISSLPSTSLPSPPKVGLSPLSSNSSSLPSTLLLLLPTPLTVPQACPAVPQCAGLWLPPQPQGGDHTIPPHHNFKLG